MKYRLEIYQDRCKNYNADPFRIDTEKERVRILEGLLLEVKLENLQERTEKEKLRLEVDLMNGRFSSLCEQYTKLNDSMQSKKTDYAQRLSLLSDQITDRK